MHMAKMQVLYTDFSIFFHNFQLFLRKSLEKRGFWSYFIKQQA